MSSRIAKAAMVGAVAALGFATAAQAAGDVSKGKMIFNRCQACHMIKNGDEVIHRGGQVGPNLYGVVGRQAGSYDDFNYSKYLKQAGKKGLVWTQDKIAQYVQNPSAYIADYLGEKNVHVKMMYKLRHGGEDVAAYLASVEKSG